MGSGWRDVISTDVWGAVLQTQFGGVWLWQIILALVTLVVVIIVPRSMPRRLLMLTIAQFILLAGVGHATLHSGITGAIQQVNHALHLICAATLVRWPATRTLLYANGAWPLARTGHQHHDAFLPLRASFVIGVLLTGIMNALFIVGFSVPRYMAYGRLLLLKGARSC